MKKITFVIILMSIMVLSPITFIISLFSKSVYVYEVHNNGGWYTFGFLMGASITFGGSGGGAASRRKKRR